MADGAAGVGGAGDGLPVAAFSVLADEHFAVFAFDCQHAFAAVRSLGIRQVIMPEIPLPCFDFCQDFFCVPLDVFHE